MRHACLLERGFHIIEDKFDFGVDVGGNFAGLGIDADVTRKIERVPGKNPGAIRRFKIVAGQMDRAAFRGMRRLREGSLHSENARSGECNYREYYSGDS